MRDHAGAIARGKNLVIYQFLPQRIQSVMKQPTDQQERNEDKKKPENENPSHGIDPERKEPEKKLVNE